MLIFSKNKKKLNFQKFKFNFKNLKSDFIYFRKKQLLIIFY